MIVRGDPHSIPRPGRPLLLVLAFCTVVLLLSASAPVQAQFTWSFQVVERNVTGSGPTSLALDSLGRPHLAYVDGSTGRLRYAWWDGDQWRVMSAPSYDLATGSVSLALDFVDRPHISFYDFWRGSVMYAHFDGFSWRVLTVNGSHADGHSSLALDPEGVPYVAYVYRNGDLQLAHLRGSTWISEAVDREVVTAKYPSLAFDGDTPEIAYYGNGELRHAEPTIHGWWIDHVDEGATPADITLAIGPQSRGVIAYRAETTQDLRFARESLATWRVEDVDTEGEVGWDARLALDGAGNPHISYYDQTHGYLKYAHREGDSWTLRVVDFEGIVGWFSSIAVDDSGRPHFAYYSWSEQAIKYARGDFGAGVRTWFVQDLTHNSARLIGEVTGLGGASQAQVHFEWREGDGEWAGLEGATLTAPGFVEAILTGLRPETVYEVRAVASIGEDLLYGKGRVFETEGAPPVEPPIPESVVVLLIVGGTLGALSAYYFLGVRRAKLKGEARANGTSPLRREWLRATRKERQDR